jgi:hypothetical protein
MDAVRIMLPGLDKMTPSVEMPRITNGDPNLTHENMCHRLHVWGIQLIRRTQK